MRKNSAGAALGFASNHRLRRVCVKALAPIIVSALVFGGCSSARVTSQPPRSLQREAQAASFAAHNCKGQPKIESGDGHFVVTDLNLRELIGEAYDLSFGQSYAVMTQPSAKLFGVSDWSGVSANNSRCYDIDAPVDSKTTLEQNLLLLRPLLTARFKLVVHEAKQQTQVYLLTLEKPGQTGPQLTRHMENALCDAPRASLPLPPYPSSPLPCHSGPFVQGNRIFAFDTDVDTFAKFLTGLTLERPVVNETGLKGTFDFDLRPESGSKESLIEALQSQLGFKLEPATRDIRVLVIDNVQEPAEN